jgi:pSer/pThr/pTyr-binding forkhead associated (FHA) protein
MWVLETDAAGPTRATYRLLTGEIKTIGRAVRADFILDAPLVSRLHCRLTAGHGLEVLDLNSTNGTFVNGKRVTRATLRPGDRLTVGRVDLTVRESTL